jgi:hypothetical protein
MTSMVAIPLTGGIHLARAAGAAAGDAVAAGWAACARTPDALAAMKTAASADAKAEWAM